MATSPQVADSSRENLIRMPLLATKLHMPPIRQNLISRPHLLHSLTPDESTRLILLSAPPGFGKTTLLTGWLTIQHRPAGWVSLDKGDNDPVRFWSYVIAALQKIQPDIGKTALGLLSTAQASPMETVLTVLINDLDSLGGSSLLVLDDYHAIDNPIIHSSMAFFLDHLPACVHMVIATRVDPLLPLAHLRANGSLLEIRVDKLRFTREETYELLNDRLKLGLSATEIDILTKRTEGWIVGLQLAALSLQGRMDTSKFVEALSGSNRYILDYLVEQALNLQPNEIQDFLLQTCILERLCSPLCDALLTDDNARTSAIVGIHANRSEVTVEQKGIHSSSASAQNMLEYLEKANLFIVPLDDERKWYRFHHLFADLLRIKLIQSYGAVGLRTLHTRAARWYAENNFPAEAIEHAIAAEDLEYAAQVIEHSAESAWLGGEFYQVLRWIEALPKEVMRNHPWLCVWYIWSRMQAGTMDSIEELIDDAERAARICPDQSLGNDQPQDRALTEQIAALRITCAGIKHETDKTIELARHALELPAFKNQAASLMARTNVLNVLGFAYYVKGELSQAERVYHDARMVARNCDFVMRELLIVHKLVHLHQDMGQLLAPYQLCQEALSQLQEQGRQAFFAAGYLYCDMAHLLIEWNRLDDAERMIAQSAHLNDLAQVPHLTLDTCNAWARLYLAQGQLEAAQQALQRGNEIIQKHYCWPEVVSTNQVYQSRLWLASDELQTATEWVERYRIATSEHVDFLDEMAQIARARVLLALGIYDEAFSLLDRLAGAAETGSRNGRLIEILALQALCLSNLNAVTHAHGSTGFEFKVLERSLQLAKSEGYMRLYIDEGPSMFTLLKQAAILGIEPDYVHKLLNAFPICQNQNPSKAPAPGVGSVSSCLVEPLSDRELEVLRLMAKGLSNREIAELLVLANGTVKVHAHNICGKLSVRNRTQAILRAQQLGLLT